MVQNRADSVGAVTPYDAFIGQNGPIAPSDPFDPSAPPGGTVQAPPQAQASQPDTVRYTPPGHVAQRPDILSLIMDSAWPGSGVPSGPNTGPIEASSPAPMSSQQAVAEMQRLDPNAFGPAGAPPSEPLMAFEDVPIGDTLTVQNPWPVTPQGGPSASPVPPAMPPVNNMVRGAGANRPQVAPPTAAVAPPIMPSPQMIVGPQGGSAPARPTQAAAPIAAPPSAPSPAPALQAARPPQGLLRRPPVSAGPEAYAMASMPDPAAAVLAQLQGSRFLASEPQPAGPTPTPLAATVQQSPAPVPASNGGPQSPAPAPQQGAVMPQHLKDQLLQEAIRLTAQKRMPQPQGAR